MEERLISMWQVTQDSRKKRLLPTNSQTYPREFVHAFDQSNRVKDPPEHLFVRVVMLIQYLLSCITVIEIQGMTRLFPDLLIHTNRNAEKVDVRHTPGRTAGLAVIGRRKTEVVPMLRGISQTEVLTIDGAMNDGVITMMTFDEDRPTSENENRIREATTTIMKEDVHQILTWLIDERVTANGNAEARLKVIGDLAITTMIVGKIPVEERLHVEAFKELIPTMFLLKALSTRVVPIESMT